MPICTRCTHPVDRLYTLYDSAYNLRLEQCPNCLAFADPYIEHDSLTLLLDLILLKRDVYRHLLFNRGAPPRRVHSKKDADASADRLPQPEDPLRHWLSVFKLGLSLITVDAFIRWSHIHPPSPKGEVASPLWTDEAIRSFIRILIGCILETIVFHGVIMLGGVIALKFSGRASQTGAHPKVSGTRQNFRLYHIPLALFYSSLTKLFLLLSLSIWRATPTPAAPTHASRDSTWYRDLLEFFDEDKLDREWVVRNVLGGMAGGFGLRVILDCHPVFTTLVVLCGWTFKTAVASMVSGWVGNGFIGHEYEMQEKWLAYSIP